MTPEEHLGIAPATFPEVKEIFMHVYEKHGEAKAVELLDQFRVEKLSELPKEDWDQFIRYCRDWFTRG